MSRVIVVWGGAVAGVLGLAALMLAVVLASVATPEAYVSRYLHALANDNLPLAAELAGLDAHAAIPLGDSGAPSAFSIIGATSQADGSVVVVADYGDATDTVRTTFSLVPGDARFGVIPVWEFRRPPVASVLVGVDEYDSFTVNGHPVQAEGAGRSVAVAGFIPARVTARLNTPFLEANPISERWAEGARAELILTAVPSERLTRTLTAELRRFLTECTTQQVLRPTGCSFGVTIDDRVLDRPQWQLVTDPLVVLEASRNPGRWALTASADVQLVATVQDLFDGTVSQRDETISAVILGEVVVRPEGPSLVIYPPVD